jgi:hypothetical protein
LADHGYGDPTVDAGGRDKPGELWIDSNRQLKAALLQTARSGF